MRQKTMLSIFKKIPRSYCNTFWNTLSSLSPFRKVIQLYKSAILLYLPNCLWFIVKQMLKEIFHHQRNSTDQVDFTFNFFRNWRHYLIKIAQAWNLAQGKPIESQMVNSDKKLSSVAIQISILICFFCRNVPDKQKTNKKTFEQLVSSISEKDFLRSWLIPWETHLKEF